MNITTKDILAFNTVVDNHVAEGVEYILDDEQDAKARMRIETDAIGQQPSICSAKEAKILEGKMDMNKLKSDMGEQFFNYQAMVAVGCSTYATFHGIQENTGNIARVAMLKDSIRGLHKIGDESAYGYVMTGEIGGADGVYVVKVPRTDAASKDLTHELFVGLFGTNRLRKVIPNMAMIFGGFKCSGPIFDDEGEVTSFCSLNSGPDTIPYVIYENIVPSTSFDSEISTLTVRQFHQLFLQVCFATDIASELIGYTGYDSHSGNWLRRVINVPGVTDQEATKDILQGEFCIPYHNHKTGVTTYLTADSIATAIDFGMATIKYKGKNMGPYDVRLQAHGVVDGPWPLHDIYKLMMFLSQRLVKTRKNPLVLAELEKIFWFFNKTESLASATVTQRPMYYFLPAIDKTIQYTITDLINYIAEECDVGGVMLESPGNIPVLECTHCNTFLGTVKGAYISTPHPTTLLEFYDVASHMGKSSKVDYDDLVAQFDYKNAVVKFKDQIETAMADLNKELSNPEIAAPVLPNPVVARSLAHPILLKDMTASYNLLFDAVSHYEDLETWLKVGRAVAILYNDTDFISFINTTNTELESKNKTIQTHISNARANYRLIEPIIKSREWQKYEDKYWWYKSRSGDIVHMVNRFREDQARLFTEERLPSTLIKIIQEQQKQVNDTIKTVSAPEAGNRRVLHPNRSVKVSRDANGRASGITVSK